MSAITVLNNILDLPGVYADPHRHPERLHSIAYGASAADGGGRCVEDGKELIRDKVYLFRAVAGELLADERGVLRSQLQPATIAYCDDPFCRAKHVDKEHGRQHTSRCGAWAWAPVRIERLEGREVGRQVRDNELENAFGTGKALKPMRAEVP